MLQNKKIMKYGGIIAGIVLVFTIVGIIQAKRGAIPELTTAIVEEKNIMQSVHETGTVEANVKVEFGWEKSGKVVQVFKKVGDPVVKGDLLAQIDASAERTNVAQAVASLRAAEAALNLKYAGPTNENFRSSLASVEKAKAAVLDAEANVQKTEISNSNSIAQAQRALETAQNNLRLIEGGENSQIINDAYEDLVNSIKSTITKLNDALIESDNILGVDNKFANDEYEELLGKQQASVLETAKASYLNAKSQIDQAEAKGLSLLSTSNRQQIEEAKTDIERAVGLMQRNLTDVKNVLNATLPGNDLSQAELAGLKSSVLTAQTSLNSAAADLTNTSQAIATARNSLTSYKIAFDSAKQDLENAQRQADVQRSLAQAALLSQKAALTQAESAHASLIARPRAIDVASYQADVARNRAVVAEAQNELSKTELRALADGVLSKLEAEVGETITMNSPVATILSQGLAIKVDISETDIAKVSLQDPAVITLDAFGEDVQFKGTVVAIEPAETQISGVVYYKTTVVFDGTEEKMKDVKPGMTANVTLTTDTRENVVVVPSLALVEKDGKQFVRVVTDKKKGKFEEKNVKIGLKGDGAEVEILEGITEGQEIVTSIKENK